jgi:hypothetical protein
VICPPQFLVSTERLPLKVDCMLNQQNGKMALISVPHNRA